MSGAKIYSRILCILLVIFRYFLSYPKKFLANSVRSIFDRLTNNLFCKFNSWHRYNTHSGNMCSGINVALSNTYILLKSMRVKAIWIATLWQWTKVISVLWVLRRFQILRPFGMEISVQFLSAFTCVVLFILYKTVLFDDIIPSLKYHNFEGIVNNLTLFYNCDSLIRHSQME